MANRGRKPLAGTGQSKPTTVTKEEAQRLFLEMRSSGMTVREAARRAGRSEKAVELWRRQEPRFKELADQATAHAKGGKPNPKSISFEDFCEKYFGQRVFWHQQQWVDILEGREPRDLHPAERYEPSRANRLLVNTPVHHAKSATLTINYVVYRICMDSNIRIKIVSKTQNKAREFLHAIKQRLTHPQYTALQADFGPQGGWKATADAWRADWIYLGGAETTAGEKDPTVEALGIGGQIYGARANLIILDDCIVGSNAHEWEKQINWLNREVSSRLGRTGKLLVVGTRIAPMDLYLQLRNGDNFSNGKSPFTYFAQPAVLEFAEDPKDWKTLWPRSNSPIEAGSDEEEPDDDGMYPAWDGPALATVRDSITANDWAMIYMQADVDENSTFSQHAVIATVNQQRNVGPLRGDIRYHNRRQGMDGLYVIGSIDPSGSGKSGFLVYAVDRETRERFVLNAKVLTPWTWPAVRKLVQEWTETFGINEWVVEKNMYHAGLVHDEQMSSYLQTRGVRMREHFTGRNKNDVNLGVSSMADLFGQYRWDNGKPIQTLPPMISLPSRENSEGVKTLVEQLVTWSPDTKNATDMVMALWFAEIRARELTSLAAGARRSHANNRFATARSMRGRTVVNIQDLIEAG